MKIPRPPTPYLRNSNKSSMKSSYKAPRISRILILQEIIHQSCKETEANVFSKLLFLWVVPLMELGYSKVLQPSDLFDIPGNEKVGPLAEKFDKLQNGEKTVPLLNMLWRLNRPLIVISFLLKICAYVLQFSGPICLGKILDLLSDENFNAEMGFIYAGILVGCYLIRNVLQQFSILYIAKIAIRIQNCLYGKIYEKILRLSAASKKFQDSGKILNLVNIDIFAIWNFTQLAFFLISYPVVFVLGIILIIVEVSWTGLIGIGIILIGFFLQTILQKKIYILRKSMLKYTDKRSKAVNEYISGVKIIKFYGWESMAIKRISKIREKEVALLYKQGVSKGLVDLISVFVPIINPVIVFLVYSQLFDDFTASKVYTVVSLYNLIQDPLKTLAVVLLNYINCKTGIKRIEHFLQSEEKSTESVYIDESLPIGTIDVQNANFTWETNASKQHHQDEKDYLKNAKKVSILKKELTPKKEEKMELNLNTTLFTPRVQNSMDFLSNIDFSAEKGQLTAIVGAVGSGKSSLAHAILGEMITTSGLIRFNGVISYVPQTAWLMNSTLRNNILFYNEYNEEKFNEVIKLCELEDDIKNLPGEDLTEIGERGLNLSGGQKQRISLARAVYANTDIYIIDDVLSALDQHVGEKIFQNVIKGYLKNKTVVFITHALQYTSEADQIIVLKKGLIHEKGQYFDLMSDPNSEFSKINIQQQRKKKEEEEKKQEEEANLGEIVIKKAFTTQNEQKQIDREKIIKGALLKVEERSIGSIPWRIYKIYISMGGTFLAIETIFFFAFTQACKILNDWWLGLWASDDYHWSVGRYVGVYIAIAVIGSLFVFVRALIFFKFNIRSAESFHKRLFVSLMKCPLSWYDIHPIGRIMGRTTKDQDNLDSNLQSTLQFLFLDLLMICGAVILNSIITPFVLIFVFISIFIYGYLMKRYIKTSRDIKRIELNSRNPVSSIFEETSRGTYVIRASAKESNFIKNMMEKCDELARAIQNNIYSSLWIGLRTDLFGTFFIGASAFFGVLYKSFGSISDPKLIGLSITVSLQISQMLTFVIKRISDTENYMSSAQRILEYIENNESERDLNLDKEYEIPEALKKWPENGIIKAENLKYTYRQTSDLVIKGISFEIGNFEKIGIVGRTGSGKSTLTLGILRILELFDGQGKITIANQNIGELNLHLLRKKIVIIPQDPVLFSGSLRRNIDPFVEYSDKLIIEALEKVQLLEQLKNKDGGDLDSKGILKLKIFEDGCNFSLGQKQLICICRALIRKPKILLMDEATANIDQKTDALIQKMIKCEFKNTTVITIAHRLNTIIHYDKIMVLDNGKLMEFDTPLNLIEKKDSLFGSLLREHGKDFEEKMIFLAKNKESYFKSLELDLEKKIKKSNFNKINFSEESARETNQSVDCVEIAIELNHLTSEPMGGNYLPLKK